MDESRRRTLLFSLLQICYWSLAFITDGVYASFLRSLGYGEAFIGSTLTLAGLAGLLLCPGVGYLSDRFCRFRWTAAAGFVLMAGFLPAVLLSGAAWTVTLYAFLGGGFTKVLSGVLDSWITKLGDRSMDFGRIRSVGSIAYAVVAVLFGRLFDAMGYGVSGILAVLLAGTGILCSFLLPDPEQGETEKGPGLAETARYLLGNRRYLLFLFCMVLMNVTTQSLFAFFALLVEDAGGTVGTLGAVYFVMAGMEFFVVRRHTAIAGRLGERRTAGLGMTGNFVKSMVFSLVKSVPGVFGATLTQCLSFALIVPASPVYQAEIVDRRYLATAQLVLQTCCTSIIPFALSATYGRMAEQLGSAGMIRRFSFFALAGGLIFLFLSARMEKKETAEQVC